MDPSIYLPTGEASEEVFVCVTRSLANCQADSDTEKQSARFIVIYLAHIYSSTSGSRYDKSMSSKDHWLTIQRVRRDEYMAALCAA